MLNNDYTCSRSGIINQVQRFSQSIPMNFKLPSNWIMHAAVVLVSLFSFILFVLLLLPLEINYPWADEFSVLLFFKNLESTSSTWEKLGVMFAPFAEHRIFFARLMYLIQYTLLGELNFTHLKIFNLLCLSVFLAIFYFAGRFHNNSNGWLFLAIPFMFFQATYWEIALWTFGGLSHFFSPLFALLSFFLITRQWKYGPLFACLACFFSVFSNGNGMLTVPLGLAIFLYQKRFLWAGIYGIFGTILVLVYFSSSLGGAPSANPELITKALNDYSQVLITFLSFVGSFAAVFKEQLSAGIGLAAVVYIVYLTFVRYYDKNPMVFAAILFVLGSYGMASIARIDQGYQYSLRSEYRINSVILLVCIYTSICELFIFDRSYFIIRKRRVGIQTLAIIFLFFGVGCMAVSFKRSIKEAWVLRFYTYYMLELETGCTKQYTNPTNRQWLWQDQMIESVAYLKQRGMLGQSIDERWIARPVVNRFELNSATGQVAGGSDYVSLDSCPHATSFFVQGWGLVDQLPSDNTTIYLAVSNDTTKSYHLYSTVRQYREDVSEYFKSVSAVRARPSYDAAGYVACLDRESIPIKRGRLAIVVVNGNNVGIKQLSNGKVYEFR